MSIHLDVRSYFSLLFSASSFHFFSNSILFQIINTLLMLFQMAIGDNEIFSLFSDLVQLELFNDTSNRNVELSNDILQLLLKGMPFRDHLLSRDLKSLEEFINSFTQMFYHKFKMINQSSVSRSISKIRCALYNQIVKPSQLLELNDDNIAIAEGLIQQASGYSSDDLPKVLSDFNISLLSKTSKSSDSLDHVSPSLFSDQLSNDIIKELHSEWSDSPIDKSLNLNSSNPNISSLTVSLDSDRSLSLAQRPSALKPSSGSPTKFSTLREFVLSNDSDESDSLPLVPHSSPCVTSSSSSKSILDFSLFNKSVRPIPVRGSQNPLSNMYVFRFNFNDIIFHSVEQAYQYYQSIHFDDSANAELILQESSPFRCRALNSKFRFLRIKNPVDPKSIDWEENKLELMRCMLSAKRSQCPAFLDSLLKTGTAQIYHPTRDFFWGTGSASLIPRGEGRDQFSYLLMDLRYELLSDAKFDKSLRTVSGSSGQSSSNDSLIDEASSSSVSEPIAAAAVPKRPLSLVSSTPQKKVKSSSSSNSDHNSSLADQSITNSFQFLKPLSPFTFSKPLFDSVIICDSNGKYPTPLPPHKYTLYCFSGANFTKLYYASRSLEPFTNVKYVFSCVGVNCRDSDLQSTVIKSFSKYHSSISKLFPNSKIYHSQVYFNPLALSFTQRQIKNLDDLNGYLNDLAVINFIPKPLDLEIFFEKDGIHLQQISMHRLMHYWLSQQSR